MRSERIGRVIGGLAYVGFVWWIIRPGHTDPAAGALYHAARGLQHVAGVVGRAGLTAEAAYWRRVK